MGKPFGLLRSSTVKNTTMMSDCLHARSVDGQSHPSRAWVKNFHSTFSHEIPEGWRICGENMYAQHSISYDELETYFYGFSIWTDRNECLSVDDTLEWFTLLGITPVPVLYHGEYNEAIIKSLWSDKDWNKKEGYVIRNVNQFNYSNFRWNVAKFVRKGHVQTTKHWMHGQAIVPNKLKGDT